MAVRGLAGGALTVALAWGAISAMGLRSGLVIADWAIGIAVTSLPLLALFLVLRIPTALVARLLRGLGTRLGERGRRRVRAVNAILQLVGRPWLSIVIGIALLVWASGETGPLSMWHFLFFAEVPIVIGALVGLLVGLAAGAAELPAAASRRRVAAVAMIVPALLLGAGGTAWAVLPGAGDPVVHEAPLAFPAPGSHITFALADPGQTGPYAVVAASYGSGHDGRRVEFGSGADWITPTVDASLALGQRGGIAQWYADWLWGYDARRLPLNGLVWYPAEAETGPLGVALIVHGNHTAGDFSDPGYAYLGEHLASRGLLAISIDENYLNGDPFFDYAGSEMATRAWLLLRHLEQLRAWNDDPAHPLAGRIDLERVALIGHSRGGEAAAIAAAMEATPDSSVSGLPAVPRGFGIRAVVAFAPSDGMYSGPLSPVTLEDTDYLVIQGGHDGDLPSYAGLRSYHRVEFTGSGDHLKVALYDQRANHGRFNSVWNDGDAGALASWLLDRGSLLSAAEQQDLAKTVVGAFLARSLDGETGYDAFFREPRAGAAWLPDDVVETHWASSTRVLVDAFGSVGRTGGASTAAGFDRTVAADPGLRDKGWQGDTAARLTWSHDAAIVLAVTPEQAATIDPDGSLVFSLVAANIGLALDPTVELRTAGGDAASVRLSDIAPLRPLLSAQLWKSEALGSRYLPGERLSVPFERFMQTYELPLAAFRELGADVADIREITVRFEGGGDAFLDDVGFEPGLAGS